MTGQLNTANETSPDSFNDEANLLDKGMLHVTTDKWRDRGKERFRKKCPVELFNLLAKVILRGQSDMVSGISAQIRLMSLNSIMVE